MTETKIAYLCDHRACKVCYPDDCQYTHNIKHAENFSRKRNVVIEKGKGNEYCYIERRQPYAIPLSYIGSFMGLLSGYGLPGFSDPKERTVALKILQLLVVNWKHDTGEFIYRGAEDD